MIALFNIGFMEIVLILIIAFVVVGPDDLPKLARGLGKGFKRVRGFINDVRSSVNEDPELHELNEELSGLRQEVDPLMKDLSEAKKGLAAAMDPAGAAVQAAKDELKVFSAPSQDLLKQLKESSKKAADSE